MSVLLQSKLGDNLIQLLKILADDDGISPGTKKAIMERVYDNIYRGWYLKGIISIHEIEDIAEEKSYFISRLENKKYPVLDTTAENRGDK